MLRWFGRCRPWQGQTRPQACHQEACCGDAAGGEGAVGASGVMRREGEDQDELGETYPGGVLARTRARAKRALCSRSGHARHSFDKMPG